jgi:hypothetical protein
MLRRPHSAGSFYQKTPTVSSRQSHVHLCRSASFLLGSILDRIRLDPIRLVVALLAPILIHVQQPPSYRFQFHFSNSLGPRYGTQPTSAL